MLDRAPAHPRASDQLSLLVDFLNTFDQRTFQGAKTSGNGPEELTDPRALVRWLAAHGLALRTDKASEGDLSLARDLRAELRAALLAREAGPRGVDLSSVAACRLRLQVRFGRHGDPELVSTERESAVRQALSQVVVRAFRGAVSSEWPRLRICAAPDCHWVFYDRSKAGAGRWCSMRVCGNRVKTRAYRASLANAG